MPERYNDFEQAILDETRKEWLQTDPVAERCKVVAFVSRSGGKGKRRRPREVKLFIVDGRYAHQIIRGEIRGNKNRIPVDTLAMEVLSDLPDEERTVDKLLERAIAVSNI